MYQEPESNDELLVCFDEQGSPIEPHTRREVHAEPLAFWHGVVNVWLIDHRGQLLCSKRSEALSGNPGKWQTYFGGHVKAGKTFQEAAVMELDEEVGLRTNPEKLYLIEKGKYEQSKHFFESYAYFFGGQTDNLKFNDGEITEVKWLDMDEYNLLRKSEPELWCNGCSPENQEKIKKLNLKKQ